MKTTKKTISAYRATLVALMLGCAATTTGTAVAHAAVLTIDQATAGTLIDGLLDGFPGVATFDGVADFAGNPLAVALKDGATEERGIIEYPLDTLTGLSSSDIQSATLTWNIDDVLSTFGPGTDFDGTAAETVILFDYAGNGSIDLSDFQNVAGAPLAVVDTTPFGVITDASLAGTGPLVFEVDVTAAIQAHLDAADTHMGLVFATNDDQSGTSLDDLGDGGAGPPGVNGASLPFVTIVTVTGEPPVFGKKELKCQKAIAKTAGKFVKTAQKELGKCLNSVLLAVSKGQDLTAVEAKCRAGIDAADPASKLAKANTGAINKIVGSCSDVSPGDINSPCDALATDANAMATCVVSDHTKRVEQMVRAEFADGCNLLGAVNLDDQFTELCTAP